ncbi:MAG: invasion associated locus B family protein [Kiloniellaceae bacterium]
MLYGAVAAGGLLALLPAVAQAQTQQPIQPPAAQEPPPPAAGDPGASGQVFGDWRELCTPTPPPGASPPPQGEQNVCFITQQVMDQNSQRPVLKITIGFFGEQRQAGAVIAMPLGVPLARGIEISVDGKEVRTVPFQICRRDGCQAYLLLDDVAVTAFKAGTRAQARVASTEGEGLNLPISLTGFTAGFGSIQ